MPLRPFQENYWNLSDTTAPPPLGGGGGGGYPLWQSVVVASMFGALWDLGASWWARLAWWVRLARRMASFSASQRTWADRLLLMVPAPERAESPPGAWVAQVATLEPSQQAIVDRVVTLLTRPEFVVAQAAVRQTATTLGFNRPEAWGLYAKAIKADAGRAENVFRHVKAHELTRHGAREVGSTLSNPTAHLLVELAYHEFAIKGR